MLSGPEFCRDMHAGEEAAVERLLQAAFGGDAEVKLVRQLRKDRAIAGEMVLPGDQGVIGYFALSEFRAPKTWLCLAPVAIHPTAQGRGLGTRMMGLLTEWARLSGRYVVVLGQPDFYRRAGFSHSRAAQLRSPYPITHTLLAGPGGDAPKRQLIYPKAFEGM